MGKRLILTKNKNRKRRIKRMVRHSGIFSQVVSLINRNSFNRLVKSHNAERYSKGFGSWDQFVSMLFCQVGQARSLREICDGLSSSEGKLRHLGMKQGPKRSTLSYANANRPWEMFRDLFYDTLSMCRNHAPCKHKFRFKNKLLSLGSTTISLCLSLFPWAKFRRTKGAVKLHLLLDHDGYMPTYALITNGKKHDVTMARKFPLARGSIVAMDKGYNDYGLFADWTENGIYFVTRLKDNASYDIISENDVSSKKNILSDQFIEITGSVALKKCPYVLRRVVVWDETNQRELVLLTNHLEFSAKTISAIYKDRWQIELFFKAIKQNLRIKTFVGTSENALYIQIWTALISILLLKFMQFKPKIDWSLSNLVALTSSLESLQPQGSLGLAG
jgi:hypothetical protein